MLKTPYCVQAYGGTSYVIADFVLKIANFRHHGNEATRLYMS